MLLKILKIFQNIKIDKDDYSFRDAVITLFVFKTFTNQQIKLLNLFIKSHETYNTNSIIFIFTNLDISKIKISERVKIINFPYTKNKIMSYRVAFNYNVILKFIDFKKVYLFDTDLIAIKDYNYLDNGMADVGVTICNNWLKKNKFPINAGFLLINNNIKQNIVNFAKYYLSSYFDVLKNKELIINNTNLKHSKFDLEEWWGDQYLFFYLFDKFPNNVKNFCLCNFKGLTFKFFNEDYFNLQSYELKKANNNFNVKNFINTINKDVYFLHLAGNKKRHVENISTYLTDK